MPAMSSRLLHPDEYELASRSSLDSEGTFNLDDDDFESQVPPPSRFGTRRSPWLSRFFSSIPGYSRVKTNNHRPIFAGPTRPTYFRRCTPRRRFCYIHVVLLIISALVVLTSIFRPSYTHPPTHYAELQQLTEQSTESGRGNRGNEKVFIAASIYDPDGELARGQWATQLLQLIDLLGQNNVFVSIYENDSGNEGRAALRELKQRIPSDKSIVFEDHLDLKSIPSVTIPGGETRVKRIEYLAQVRNKALKYLDDNPDLRFHKILYLNDILFNPMDAVHLLFSTNVDTNGLANYRAACAVDFDNPFKFYDTYATRDLQGYSMGLPFFPWFSSAGSGESRKDVLQGKDAVRVRSCWGGMVAFDARFFQDELLQKVTEKPVRFRSGNDLFWEASECCLIHADIQEPLNDPEEASDRGIYMNPYVRVSYDARTLSWLGVTRRFERLYSHIHNIGNHLVGLPWYNPRRTEKFGEAVQETVWVSEAGTEGGGSFQVVDRIAGKDGFCGRRGLQVIVEDRKPGQKGYESIPVPQS